MTSTSTPNAQLINVHQYPAPYAILGIAGDFGRGTYGYACSCGKHVTERYLAPANADRAALAHMRGTRNHPKVAL